jgi:hypothetical protein
MWNYERSIALCLRHDERALSDDLQARAETFHAYNPKLQRRNVT